MISMLAIKKRGHVFVLDIIQATFVTAPTVDLPTSSLYSILRVTQRYSQGHQYGMGTQVKPSNVSKHMPTQRKR